MEKSVSLYGVHITTSLALTAADRPSYVILADLREDHGTWSKYETVNPLTGSVEPKRTWLILHGVLIFGVAYYNP